MALNFIQVDNQTFQTMTKDPQAFYHVLSDTNIYGAEWAGTYKPAFTRTDAAVGFADPVPQMSDGNGGWIGGSSPFDYIYPWSKIRAVEDEDAGTLVAIPKFYYKWSFTPGEPDPEFPRAPYFNKMKLQISAIKHDGFLTSPAHADRGDGQGERSVVYVGRYNCCASDFKSTTGELSAYPYTASEFRQNIHNLGNDYWMYDYALHWTILMLYIVEFASWDSQGKIGLGSNAGGISGATDAMTYHTGTSAASKETAGAIQYRYIEDLWGGNGGLIDGIFARGTDQGIYCMKNPADYDSYSNATCIRMTPIELGDRNIATWVSNNVEGFEYALLPQGYSSGEVSSSTYITDYYYKPASYDYCLFRMGANTSADKDRGLFYLSESIPSTAKYQRMTARIQKLPS